MSMERARPRIRPKLILLLALVPTFASAQLRIPPLPPPATTLPRSEKALSELRQDYYDLDIAFRDGAFIVRAVMPAAFPHPEARVNVTFNCETASWNAQSDVAQAEFDRFVHSTEAATLPNGFGLKDVIVSCTRDGQIAIQSNSIKKTLTLIDKRARYPADLHAVAGIVNEPGEYVGVMHEPNEYIGVAFRSNFRVRLWNGSIDVVMGFALDREIRDRSATIGVDVGDGQGLQPLLFEAQLTPRAYDASEAIKLVANVGGSRGYWDYLELHLEHGSVVWWRTSDPPQ